MGLFRPYEQGKTETKPERKARRDKAGDAAAPMEAVDAPEAVTAEPEQSTPAAGSAGAASAAPNATGSTGEAGVPQETKVRQPVKKGAPTRSRAQAEADRMERLHPTLTPKQQRQADRLARSEASSRRWDAVERSDERVLLRDYIDARWTFSEFIIPLVIVLMAFSMFALRSLALQQIASIAMLAVFMIWIADNIRLWQGFKKELQQRAPEGSPRGLLMVLVNRAMTIRRLRRPGPRIERGAAY